MGERENFNVATEDDFAEDHNDFESEKNLVEDLDFNLVVARDLCERIAPLDDQFNKGKINRDQYFDQLQQLRDKLLEQNEDYPEETEMINLIYNGSLMIHSACKRFQSNVEKKKENLALAEAKWQIQMGRYFYNCKDQPITVAMTELFLNRMRSTYKTLNFDDDYINGIMRGVKGLIATSLALEKMVTK